MDLDDDTIDAVLDELDTAQRLLSKTVEAKGGWTLKLEGKSSGLQEATKRVQRLKERGEPSTKPTLKHEKEADYPS